MAEWKGMIVSCDRCGKEIRRKWLNEKKMDGGFTRIQNFEPMAEDWDYKVGIGWLCPNCEAAYKNMLDMFMADITFESHN